MAVKLKYLLSKDRILLYWEESGMDSDMGNTLINNALVLATKIHKDQTRKGTDIPYIVHPFEVALILQENGADEEMIAAGLLHDVLEDGELDLDYIKNEIKTKLNGRVLEYVIGASERLENRDKTPGGSGNGIL